MVVGRDFGWPAGEQLATNRRLLIERNKERVLAFEKSHGMRSEEMVERLECGKLTETAAIAEWVVALETLRLLRRSDK
jgi:hypothetical protein